MSNNIGWSSYPRRAGVWLWGKGRELYYFCKGNAIVLVPILLAASGEYGWAIAAFAIGVIYELYFLFKHHALWLRPAVDKIHTLLYGKPLYPHLWTKEEWAAMKRRPWRIKWGW